jgi:hypothetical protein
LEEYQLFERPLARENRKPYRDADMPQAGYKPMIAVKTYTVNRAVSVISLKTVV